MLRGQWVLVDGRMLGGNRCAVGSTADKAKSDVAVGAALSWVEV